MARPYPSTGTWSSTPYISRCPVSTNIAGSPWSIFKRSCFSGRFAQSRFRLSIAFCTLLFMSAMPTWCAATLPSSTGVSLLLVEAMAENAGEVLCSGLLLCDSACPPCYLTCVMAAAASCYSAFT